MRTNFDERIHALEKEREMLNWDMINQKDISNQRINNLIYDVRLLAQELEREAESLRALADIYEKLRK